MPDSSALRNSGRASSSWRIQGRLSSGTPKDIHPKQIRLTSKPVLPSLVYFILWISFARRCLSCLHGDHVRLVGQVALEPGSNDEPIGTLRRDVELQMIW